ncbi:MAG TPA: hypothetical protein VK689_22690 [Armatimonadota bacterium]|nr:hypothetical protein [Armatimonadota bacterium]
MGANLKQVTSLTAAALCGMGAGPVVNAVAQGVGIPVPGVTTQPRRAEPVPGAVAPPPPAALPAVPFRVPAASMDLGKHLTPAQPTVFVFTKPGVSMEHSFLTEVNRAAGRKAGVGIVPFTTGTAALARKFEVTATPTALVFDRRGRFVARGTDAEQVRAGLDKALTVMRVDWPQPGDPRYDQANLAVGRPVTGGILRTMAFQPEWLSYINQLSQRSHFSPGFLSVRIKEMIAAYVSALNHCRF